MTTDDELELDVGEPAAPVPGLPGGHLRLQWSDYEGGADSTRATAYAVGPLEAAVLLVLGLGAVCRTGL